MFCIIWKMCVLCGSGVTWQKCRIVMFLTSQNLLLQFQYFLLLYLSLQNCPPVGTSIWGIQLHSRINSDIIMWSAMELAQPIYKSFVKEQNKQAKDLYNGVRFCFLFFFPTYKLDMEYWPPESLLYTVNIDGKTWAFRANQFSGVSKCQQMDLTVQWNWCMKFYSARVWHIDTASQTPFVLLVLIYGRIGTAITVSGKSYHAVALVLTLSVSPSSYLLEHSCLYAS